MATVGNKIKKIIKNRTVTIWPISKNGAITGRLPIHPNKKQITKKLQTKKP